MSDYSSTETTLVPGVLRGYRAWRMTGDGFLFGMIKTGQMWRPGVMDAICLAPGSSHLEVPQVECTCGLYAKHYLAAVYAEFGHNMIVGSIKAYGRVILGTAGFRAEKAEIEALCAPNYYTATKLKKYEVPLFGHPLDLLREFPSISVKHLLDTKEEFIQSSPPVSGITYVPMNPWIPDRVKLGREQERVSQLWERLMERYLPKY